MKKLISLVIVCLSVLSASAINFKVQDLLNPSVFGPYAVTNAAIANGYTNAPYGGLTVSNGASGVLGAYTNTLSWGLSGIQATNPFNLNYTNNRGQQVIVTNNYPSGAGGTLITNGSTIRWIGTNKIVNVWNDTTPLMQDVELWVDGQGRVPFTPPAATNFVGESTGNSYAISPATMSIRTFGASGVSGETLNIEFIGLPDGVSEPTPLVLSSCPGWTWGITPAVGSVNVSTNFPIWRFAGCGKIRVRTIKLASGAAATCQVTVQQLRLSGWVP